MLRGRKLSHNALTRLGTNGTQSSILRATRTLPKDRPVDATPNTAADTTPVPTDAPATEVADKGAPTAAPDDVETIVIAVVNNLVDEVTAAPQDHLAKVVTIGDVLDGLSTNTQEQTTAMLCSTLAANSECMDTLKAVELRSLCTHLSLSTSGKKSDIKSRILAYHRKLTTEA